MDFSFTDEQLMLKDSVARFLKDGYDFEDYRKIASSPSGYSAKVWAQFAELQWQALPFAENDGGLGYGSAELLLLAEEMGRGLCIEPYLANVVLAGQLLARVGSPEQKQQWLTPMLAGEQQMALAYAESSARYNLSHCECRAQQTGDGWHLKGRKSLVLNAPNADTLLVIARTQGDADSRQGLGLFAVEAGASGVSLQSYAVLGGGVAAELQLDDAPAQRVGQDVLEALEDVIDLATAYSCAEAYGAMQALLSRTVDYSKTRKQFGMPLGAFQVLQHRMVDMFVEVQQSQSMILMLMLKLTDSDRAERQKAVSAAKAYLHKSSKFVAQQAVQLHGGIGVTEELDVGHYFRRLTAFGNLFGDRLHHLRRFAAIDRGEAAAASLASAA